MKSQFICAFNLKKLPIKKVVIIFSVFALLSFCFLKIVSAQEDGVPDLVVTALDAPSTVSIQQQVEVSWTISNQGNGDAIPPDGWYWRD